MSKMLRIGIAGLGRIGMVHLDAWRKTAGAEVVAAADGATEARESARSHGLMARESVEEMLDRDGIDVVSICTPPITHEAVSLQSAAAGVAVLCEKPAAADFESARRMLDGIEARRGKFQMATKFRHVPEIADARRRIALGGVRPRAFRIEFAGVADMTRRWNSDPAVAGGGVIIDNGSHALDLAVFLFGPLARVEAVRRTQTQPIMVEDSAVVSVWTESGVEGEIHLSWSAAPSSQTYLSIAGEVERIDIGWKTYDKHAAHASMMNAFRDFVDGASDGWISAGEVLANQAAVAAAYRSISTGHAEAVDDTSPALV